MSVVLKMLARRMLVLGLVVIAFFVMLASFATPGRAEQMVASWYGIGDGFAGRTTANGETFDPYAYTAAHKTLPFDTKLEVTYGGESVVVRINDRGPYIEGRDLDLSYAAARDIGLVEVGSAPVEVEYVDASTPVGPVQTAGQSAEPAPEPEPEPEPQPEPAPEPDAAPESSRTTDDGSVESVGLVQYSPIEDQVAEDQYADEEQYEAGQEAAGDQYDSVLAGEPVEPEAEPSGGSPASEYAPQQAEAGTDPAEAKAEPEEEIEQPSPATVAPPAEELEEPPAELVKPGTTIEHRVNLGIAAAPGTATDAPDTPSPAPAPVDTQADDVLLSGEAETPDRPEAEAPVEEEPLPGEGEELQEVKIEVLPDTGGWMKLPSLSLADLVAVLLVAAVLRIGLGKLRGRTG